MAGETILYHPIEAIHGKRFEQSGIYFNRLLDEGWVDDPTKIGLNPWDPNSTTLNKYIQGVNDLYLSGYLPSLGGIDKDPAQAPSPADDTARCPIWGSIAARVDHEGDGTYVESSRAGGKYFISRRAEIVLGHSEVYDKQFKARLTTWLIDQRRLGIDCPVVNGFQLEEVLRLQQVSVEERCDRLLQFISTHAPGIAEYLPFWHPRTTCLAIAWSESVDMSEVWYLADQLVSQGLLKKEKLPNDGGKYLVTAKGHSRLAELIDGHTNLDQAFVAIWFCDETRAAWEKGLKPAIEDAGYRAFRIDERDDLNKIDDEIIEEIRKSRFVVADLTHDENGARGNVYYEAGYAHALDIPVLFSCRKDLQDKVPFDTRQYHHIFWTSPEELRRELAKRIIARIGRNS